MANSPSSRFPNIGRLPNCFYFFEVNDALWPLTAPPRWAVLFPVARKCGSQQSPSPNVVRDAVGSSSTGTVCDSQKVLQYELRKW
jgi:hypothetical protein